MLTAAERAQWEESGFFIVRGLFDPAHLVALQAQADQLLAAELATRGDDGVGEFRGRTTKDAGLTNVVESEDAFGRLLVSADQVWHRVGALLGPNFIFSGSELNRAGGELEVQGWHSVSPLSTALCPCGLSRPSVCIAVSFPHLLGWRPWVEWWIYARRTR